MGCSTQFKVAFNPLAPLSGKESQLLALIICVDLCAFLFTLNQLKGTLFWSVLSDVSQVYFKL